MVNITDIISNIKEKVALSSTDTEPYIPDIMEFCFSKRYLNLRAAGVKDLYPMQKIILKTFYRGSRGNEHIKLTKDEIELLCENKMQYVLDKYNSDAIFRELVLILGRRCVASDTLLTDAKTGETKTIAEWHQQKKLSVWTYNEQFKQFEINEAETIYQGIRPCKRITLQNGEYIECTDNHPLLTQIGWKTAAELEKDDKIACAPCISRHDRELLITSADAKLAGGKKLYNICIDECPEDKLNYMIITSIEDAQKQDTYDLSIHKKYCHNYVINNGIISHNSGKDFMVSLIALYECMKLLECPGGSPFSYFDIAPGNPIYIITVATSSDQARILYTEMKEKMRTSEYFRSRIGKVEADRIWLLTPEDKRNNQNLIASGSGGSQTPGSVCILSGHSNSESLLGKRINALLLDEVASFKVTGGSASGDRIYSALAPATADFILPNKTWRDPLDNNRPKRMTDSKIISISSPRAEEGVLYDLWSSASENYRRLAFKLPTWKVNERYSEEDLRAAFKFMSPNEFQMEFGAEFSGTAGEKFIPDHYIDQARHLGAELGLKQHITGVPGQLYYIHLDPASTSHNYALIVVHAEERIRVKENEQGIQKKEKYKLFIVDHIRIWQPSPSRAINPNEVDEYVINLAKRFRIGLVTLDDWGWASLQKLRSKGIPTKITPFRRKYKMDIYSNLEHLLVNRQLALPHVGKEADLLCEELKCLKRIYGANGFKITADADASVTTDDACDALAGACYTVSDKLYAGYPKGGTVYMPQSPQYTQQWHVGKGDYTQQQWQFVHKKFGKP